MHIFGANLQKIPYLAALVAVTAGCAEKKESKAETRPEKNTRSEIRVASQPLEEGKEYARYDEVTGKIIYPEEKIQKPKILVEHEPDEFYDVMYPHDPSLTIDIPDSYDPANPELEKYWICVRDDKDLGEQRRILMSVLGMVNEKGWQADPRMHSGKYLENSGYRAQNHVVEIPKALMPAAMAKAEEVFKGCVFMTHDQINPWIDRFEWPVVEVEPFIPEKP